MAHANYPEQRKSPVRASDGAPHGFSASRAAFVAELKSRLSGGKSVLVVSHAGEGSSRVAEHLADALAVPDAGSDAGPSLLRASRHIDPGALDRFVSAGRLGSDSGGSGVRVIDSAHLLPSTVAPVLDTLLGDDRLTMAYFADGDALRSGDRDNETLELLNGAWLSGTVERVDLPPLTPAEIRKIVGDIIPTGTLDDLQLQTIVSLAGGRPLVASDLAQWALSDPTEVPRRCPRGGTDSLFSGTQAPHRLASRALGLSRETAHSAIILSYLAPLPTITAAQLVGEHTISTLTSLGLGRHDRAVGDYYVVSPLVGNSLAESVGTPGASAWAEVDTRLWRLSHSGYPIGEAATLRLARQAVAPSEESAHAAHTAAERRTTGRLLADAARISNRLGNPLEAELFASSAAAAAGAPDADTSDAGGRLSLEIVYVRLTAHLIKGESAAALELAAQVFAEPPNGPLPIPLIYTLATLVGWSEQIPAWWDRLLDAGFGIDADGASSVLSTLAGTGRIDIGEATRLAADTAAPPALRVSAATFVSQYRLNHGDAEGLLAAVNECETIIAQVMAVRDRPIDETTQLVIWFCWVGMTVDLLLAGIETARKRLAVDGILRGSVLSAEAAGWGISAASVWLTALGRLLNGELEEAHIDLRSLIALINPALLAVGWGMSSSIKRFLRRRGTYFSRIYIPGDTEEPATTRHVLLGNLLLGPGFSDLEPMPDWMRAALAHARMLDGTATAQEAASVVESLDRIGLPGPLALADHIRSAAAADAEALLDVGRRLRSMDYLDAADHALRAARAIFGSRRAAVQVAAANEELEAVAQMRTGADAATRPEHEDMVTLTKREREVCELIGEGLTNVRIGERLFLSVRTVESHVLQARSKLGAAKRADIPRRIAELTAEGRLALQF